MNFHQLLVLGAAGIALSTLPSHASPCVHDIDRAWVDVGAKIQARIGAGRSAPQGTIGLLLHHQPTPSSIAAAEEQIRERWVSMEVAVTALARAREADRVNDGSACEQAITEAQRAIVR
jgi:hypothetical protein